jgi:hypothetical protein
MERMRGIEINRLQIYKERFENDIQAKAWIKFRNLVG